MKSFESGHIYRPVPQNFLQSVRMLGEFKGRQTLYSQQTPQVLDALRQAAVVQSTESSNRIEGVVAPLTRIQAIVAFMAICTATHQRVVDAGRIATTR